MLGTVARIGSLILGVVLTCGGVPWASSISRAGEPSDADPGLNLRHVRWQALPWGMRDAYVAPDGKLWYTYLRRREVTEEDVRADLRRSFASTRGAIGANVKHLTAIVLFGPGRMVWVAHSGYVLGYDGKRFERRKISQSWEARLCKTNGQGYWGRANAVLDGKAFFLAWDGVHCFDGKGWSCQMFTPPADEHGVCHPLRMAVEHGGRGLVVFSPSRRDACWWRKGTWTTFPLPLTKKEKVHAMAPAPGGGMWVGTNFGIRFVAHPGKMPPSLIEHIEQLGHNDWKIRQKATGKLVSYGPAATGRLENALAKAKDPEVRHRLKVILSSLESKPPPLQIGTLRLEKPMIRFCDRLGRVFLTCAKIVQGGKELGPGLVVVGSDGRCEVLPGRQFAECLSPPGSARLPLWADKTGRLLWIPGRVRDEHPPRLLDLDKKAFVATFPTLAFGYLHAVMRDGTVLAGWHRSRCQVAYKPGAPENRTFLKAELLELRNFPFSSWPAPDGSLWAFTRDYRLLHFDGKQWRGDSRVTTQPAKATSISNPYSLIAGRGQVVLLDDERYKSRKRKFVLMTPRSVHTAKTLEELVAKHHKTIAAAFSSEVRRRFWASGLALVADRAGNIWVEKVAEELKVFDGKRWLDVVPALKQADRKIERASLMYAVDGGRKICFSDQHQGPNFARAGESYVARVENGKIVFSVAAPCYRSFRYLLDPRGGLWLSGYLPKEQRRVHRRVLYRVTSKETVKVPGVSFAKLAEPGGSVWLSKIWDAPGDRYRIWRDGRIVQEVRAPGSAGSWLFADRPGSVWMWSQFALQHWTADPPRGGKFALRGIYMIRDMKGWVRRPGAVWYSRRGFLSVVTQGPAPQGGQYLYILSLPGRKGPATQPSRR